MLYIDNNNNITLTRGDTLTLTVGLFQEVEPEPPATEPTQEPYTPTENEVVRFAVSKGYKGQPGYELKLSKEIPPPPKLQYIELSVVHEGDNRTSRRIMNYHSITV